MGSSLLDVGAASKVHLALDTVGMRVFVVEAGPDMLCLVVDRASSAMRNCAKRSTEQRDGAIWLAHPKGSGLMEVYGLVRDGVASAAVGGSTADVKNNVFVIADAPVSAETIAVSTKTDQRHVTIGRQVPPGVTIAADPK